MPIKDTVKIRVSTRSNTFPRKIFGKPSIRRRRSEVRIDLTNSCSLGAITLNDKCQTSFLATPRIEETRRGIFASCFFAEFGIARRHDSVSISVGSAIGVSISNSFDNQILPDCQLTPLRDVKYFFPRPRRGLKSSLGNSISENKIQKERKEAFRLANNSSPE